MKQEMEGEFMYMMCDDSGVNTRYIEDIVLPINTVFFHYGLRYIVTEQDGMMITCERIYERK